MDRNDPSQMSFSRARMEPFLKMIRTILDGTYAMRQAGPLYLPPHPNETALAYQARLDRTTLLNVLEDSIENATARLFDEQVRLEGNVPAELVDWAQDIDMQGSSLHDFCDTLMHHALADGQVHILVDYPTSDSYAVGSDQNQIDPGMMPFRPVPGNGLMARKPAGYYDYAGSEPQFDADGNVITDAAGEAVLAQEIGEYGPVPRYADQQFEPYYDDQGNLVVPDAKMMAGQNAIGAVFPDQGPNRTGLSLAEERQLGMRPYLCAVPHSNIIALYRTKVAGETIVSHVRILEEDVIRDGFAERPVRRVRILEPGRWEVWEQEGSNITTSGLGVQGGTTVGTQTGGAWKMKDQGELRKNALELWDRVPLVTFQAGKRKGVFEVKPPFLDLAYKNIEHWQSSSDQRNILAQARFPMLAVSGFEGEIQTPFGDEDDEGPGEPGPLPFQIGPNTVLTTGDPSGKWYYVEPTGSAIKLGAEDLDRLEKEMRAMGLEPLMPQDNTNTATETNINETKARSPLEEWARKLESKIGHALMMMLDWAGLPGEPIVKFKQKVTLGPQGAMDFSMLQQMRMSGNLSKLTVLEEAKRRGLLSAEHDAMEEIARIVVEARMATWRPTSVCRPRIRRCLVEAECCRRCGSEVRAPRSLTLGPGSIASAPRARPRRSPRKRAGSSPFG